MTTATTPELTLTVTGMTCQHCVRAITGAILAKDKGAVVAVDLGAGTVRAATDLPREAVAAAIAAEGYGVAG